MSLPKVDRAYLTSVNLGDGHGEDEKLEQTSCCDAYLKEECAFHDLVPTPSGVHDNQTTAWADVRALAIIDNSMLGVERGFQQR
jgi:hypothetical protein